MTEQLGGRVAFLVLIAAMAVGLGATARADGEAGLVIQDGSEVKTYCVAFRGDGITGQDLLKDAGLGIEVFGGGSGLTVCALGPTGCKDASSFTSCFCQCQGGDCTYWAFFTRQYGKNWVYSSLAFNLLKAKDGDVHGWKWGRGAANSAPAPLDITFAQICGHEPRAGVAPTVAAAATSAAPAPGSATVASTAAHAASQSPISANTPSEAPTVTVTIGTSAGIAPATATLPPLAPATGKESDEGTAAGGYLAFGAIAIVLLGAITGALVWRRRNGD